MLIVGNYYLFSDADTEIGSTKVICNQMGYIFANEHIVNGFDPKKHVEI